MKKKIIKIAIAAVAIIIGIVIMYFTHFKFDIYYAKNTRVEIYLGKEFETEKIENIVREVFPEEKEAIVEVAGAFSDTISLTTTDITNEELEQIINKINETYETELSVDSDTETIKNGNIRGRDIYGPYVVVSAIIVIIQTIITAIIYRKKEKITKIVAISLGITILIQFLYFLMLSITGAPINKMMPSVSVALYIFGMTAVMSQFENRKEMNTK